MALLQDDEPSGFPDKSLWQALCKHAPHTSAFIKLQFAEMVDGTKEDMAVYQMVVMLLVIQDLEAAARRENLKISFKDVFGLDDVTCQADFYDICMLAHSNAKLWSSISHSDEKADKMATDSQVHVVQLKLPARGSFLSPPLTLVLQHVRDIFAGYKCSALIGHYESEEFRFDWPPEAEVNPADIPNQSFVLNSKSSLEAVAVQTLGVALSLCDLGQVPGRLTSLLSGLDVTVVCPSTAEDALVDNHVQNLRACSNTKRTSDWDHYDFVVQHCELSKGTPKRGIDALNAQVQDASQKIHLRTMHRLSNLLDTKKTPPEFRELVNGLRRFMKDDSDDLPFTKTMINNALFFMGSSLAKTTGLVRSMHLHTAESFMLTCRALLNDWLRACAMHVPDDGHKWPKQPTVDAYLFHRNHITFFINLMTSCWTKAAGDQFVTGVLTEFKADPRSYYKQIQEMKDVFQQESHTIPMEPEAQFEFLLRLSRVHFDVLDRFLKERESATLATRKTIELAEQSRNSELRTGECIQYLKDELQEAQQVLKEYDDLVSAFKVSRHNAVGLYTQEFEKEKRKRMEYVHLARTVQQDNESRERFALLDYKMQTEVKKFRTQIAEATGLPETDVFILFNINLSARKSTTHTKLYASKLGNGLQTSMAPQDAVLFRSPQWFSKGEDVELSQREVRDALFGKPSRDSVPSFNKTELSLSRVNSKKLGGQLSHRRTTATFARKTKSKNQSELVNTENWLESHHASHLWGSDELWADTCMMDLPNNEKGIWSGQLLDYISFANAGRRDRIASSGVDYECQIFSNLCQGPLSANKAVGIYDPGVMLGALLCFGQRCLTYCYSV